MRYGIISDIHSNLAAFKSVLSQLTSFAVDEIWYLGDIVGYGPDPCECIKLLSETTSSCISGNHDLGIAGEIDLFYFNTDAQIACRWTETQLSSEDKKYLKNLPLKLKPLEGVVLVHGSLRDPIWEYIISAQIAEENFVHFSDQITFVGHTHIPLVFQSSPSRGLNTIILEEGKNFPLDKKSRYIINAGSVGQPRDGNPKSSFIIFDSDKFSLVNHRVAYPIRETQEKMEKVRLPSFLIKRLSYGR